MLQTFIQVGHDEFPLILNDVRDSDHCMEAMSELGIESTRCVFIIPSGPFQQRTYREREWVTSLLARSRDPEVAWENWRRSDALYSSFIREQAALFGYQTLEVDGEKNLAFSRAGKCHPTA